LANRDYFEIGVPFLAGGVVFLLGFYLLGLIVPANVARNTVTAALVHERAVLCHKAAIAYIAEVGDKTDFKAAGMAAREARDALAAKFTIESDDVKNDRLVRDACRDMLGA
jgi:putative Ca2+/H+ antiporter (TMEM165/GDT1 family)